MNTTNRLHPAAVKLRVILFTVAVTLISSTGLHAASQNWAANVNNIWDTTTANWSGSVWNSNNDAVFGSTGIGTVNIAAGGVSSGNLTFNNAGYTIAGGDLTLGGATSTITTAADALISSWIYGSIGLTKAGAGTLTLVGTNRYFGSTAVTGGVLDLVGAIYNWGCGATDTITIGTGATIRLHDGGWDIGSTGINGNFNNSNAGLLIDGGTIEMAGNYNDSGRGFSIGAGGATLTVSQAGTTWELQAAGRSWQTNGGIFGPVTNNSSLTLGGLGAGILDIPITGSGSLTKTGNGTWTLTGSNTFTGNTIISGGALVIPGTTRLYGAWMGGTVTVNTGGIFQINGWGGYGNGGWGEIDQTDITNPNNLLLNGGTLEFLGAPNGNSSSPREFSIGSNGGTLRNSSGIIWTIATTGSDSVTNNSSLTLSGTGLYGVMQKCITGSGSLTKNEAGTWTLSGANNYGGSTTVNGGVLDLTGAIYCWGGSMAITVNTGATLRLHDGGWDIGTTGINGNFNNSNSGLVINGGTVDMAGNYSDSGRGFSIGTGGATLTVSQAGTTWELQSAGRNWQTNSGVFGPVTNNSSLTLGGLGAGILDIPITGSGSLTKTGAGTWTLNGINTYTGVTAVNAGTLNISGTYHTTTVASGAALSVAGAGASGQLVISGTLALAGGSYLNLDLGSVGASDSIQVSGAYTTPGSAVLININALSGFGLGTYNLITGATGISASSFVINSAPAGNTYVLSASNGTLSLTVVIPPAFPNPTTPLGAAVTSGSAFSYQIPAANSPTSYGATGLPAGLTLNTSTGLITGTATTAGIYYASVSATNAGGTATSQLLIAVPPPTPFVQSSNNPPTLLSSSGGNMTVQPVLDNTLLINPGKGFAEYYGPSVYTASLIGVAYSRCDWVDVEPSEGAPNWAPITNLINAYAPYGLKIGYRIINVDAYEGRQYSTPPWVFQSGTNPVTHTVYAVGAAQMSIPDSTSPSGTHIIAASWEDPTYVGRMKEFIAAFGSQFNGNANIAYLDMGNYGENGEGNGTFTTGLTNVTSAQLETDFYQPYFTAFPNTQLIVNGMDWLYSDVFAWAVGLGAGRRTDSICWGVGNGSNCLICYPSHPGVMEYWSSYADTAAAGYGDPGTLMQFITGGRPSYMQFQPDFYNLYPAFCQMAGNIIGYHFVIQQATIPTSIQANVQFPMSLTWLNNGVAPLNLSGTAPCSVAVALLDGSNNVSQKQWLTTSNPKGWMPGVATTENYNVTFPSVPAGYRLAVGLFVNKTDANPTYRLGIQGRTVSGWYILTGTVNQVAATWTNASGGSWQTAGNWIGSSVRNGIDATADFSTLNLTSNATLTLDGNVTVGNLLFGDTTPSNNWTLNTGTGGGVLTLRTSPNAPTPGITVTNGTATINVGITGFMGQGLTKSGTGRLVLNGTNAYYGNTTVNAGVLEVTTNTSLYTAWAGGAVTINTGGTLQLDGWVGYAGPATGDINQSDAGNPNNLVINGGTLAFVNVGGWTQASPRALSVGPSGATLMNSSANSALWQLSLGGYPNQDKVVDNSSLTLNGAAGTTSQIDKVISGTGSLTKAGSGTWTLTGSNNYTGSTTVSAGNLTLSGSITNTASVSVASGATMNVTGKLYASGNITNSGTMIFSGPSPQFGAGGTITNNGTIINNSPSLTLPTIVNNGTIQSVPPSPWVRADIGTVGITGSATYLTGTYTVMGGGAGITGAADAFCYTYQTSSSDCSVVARVASITNTNASAKGGVMIRSTTAANSMEAGVWVTPSSGIIFTYRATTGGTTTTSSSTGKTAPYWVKITRTGNSFAGYYSTNGTTWTQLGTTQTISMGTSATIGLGVTSNVSATLCTSKIDNVTATP
jgi:autotransporter-associated beta strand protein